jgi:hypothetical protein
VGPIARLDAVAMILSLSLPGIELRHKARSLFTTLAGSSLWICGNTDTKYFPVTCSTTYTHLSHYHECNIKVQNACNLI